MRVAIHRLYDPVLCRWPVQLRLVHDKLAPMITDPDEWASPMFLGVGFDQGWDLDKVGFMFGCAWFFLGGGGRGVLYVSIWLAGGLGVSSLMRVWCDKSCFLPPSPAIHPPKHQTKPTHPPKNPKVSEVFNRPYVRATYLLEPDMSMNTEAVQQQFGWREPEINGYGPGGCLF